MAPSPLKLAAVVTLDTSKVGPGVQTTKQAFSTIGTAAETSAAQVQKLIDAQHRIAQPAANMNSRAADIAAYGQELDRLAAKFDPLVAAQARLRASLEQINQAQRVGAISASQAIDLRIREKNAYDAMVSSIGSAAAARKAFAEGAVDRVTVTPDRGADIAAYGQQLDQLRAKYNPLFAVITNYKAAVADIREAHKVGALSADEMAEALTRQRRAALGAIDAIKGTSSVSGPAAQFRRQNLTYQLFDVGQSLYGGMNPGMIAAQQGPQILQLYAGPGGANAALKDFSSLASGAARLVTPVTAGVGTLTAALVVGLKAWNDYLSSIKPVEIAAAGLGRSVAGSAADMEAAAVKGAASAGINVKAARSMEAQFLSTGKIGSENFEQLIGLSKDFATTIGIDADAAGGALSQLFADPAKAAQVLYHQYGLIDGATAEYATRLAAQNRLSDAQRVLLEGMPARLAQATEATTQWGRAWEGLGNFASNAYDRIGKVIDHTVSGKSLAEQVAAARQALAEAQKARDASADSMATWLFGGNLAQGDVDRAAGNLNVLGPQLRRQQEQAALLQAAEQQRAAGANAVDIAGQSSATSTQRQAEALQDQIAALRAGANAPGLSLEQQQQINQAIAAKSAALDGVINKQAILNQIDQLDVRIQNERNPLVRAELTGRRERLALSQQEVNADEAAAQAARARNAVVEQTIGDAAAQAGDMHAEIEIRARLNAAIASGTITSSDAQRQLQEELQLRPLILAAASAEGAEKARLTKVIEKLRAGYDGLAASEKQAAALDMIRSQRDKLETLTAQQAVLGQSEVVQARVLAQLEAEQQIRQQGLDTSSKEAQAIRSNATAIADATAKLNKAADAWNTYKSAGADAIDTLFDGALDGDKPGDIAKNLGKELLSTFSELAVKNPLKNMLTGSNLGTLSDLFSGKAAGDSILSSLGKSVGSMNVTAATVMINGGVAGGGIGSLFGSGVSAANSNASVASSVVSSAGSAVSRAMSLLGSNETSNNVDINAFLRAGGVDIDAAKTAWCAGFVNSALKQVGIDGSGSLTANSFLNWGSKVDASQVLRGDVLVQSRGLGATATGGHVGFSTGATRYVGGTEQLQMLSGNYRNGVDTSWVNASEVNIRRASDALGTVGGKAESAASSIGGLGEATGSVSKGFSNLGSGLGTAANSLNTFGNGLGQFSQQLLASASGANNPSSLLGSLGKFFGGVSPTSPLWAPNTTLGSFLVNGYDIGGYTGPGGVHEVAGLVHRGEVVWSQQDVARHGGAAVVDAMRLGVRGYAGGGVVDVQPLALPRAANGNAPAAANSNIQINIINNTKSEVQTRQRQTAGGLQLDVMIDEAVADKISTPGSRSRGAMQSQFGLSGGLARR